MKPLDLITAVFLISWSLAIMFVICELGQRLTLKFEQFSDALYQCDWYSFPIEMQEMYVIMLMNAQQPVIIKGFANTLCARESFVKVI